MGRRQRFLSSISLLLLGCVAVSAAADQRAENVARSDEPRAWMIGFVEIPEVFGKTRGESDRFPQGGPPGMIPPQGPAAVPLRAEPSEDAHVIGVIEERGDIASGLFGYELYGAIAYERSDGWFRLRMTADTGRSRAGWIAPSHSDGFHPIEEQGFTELTESWNRQLHEEPSGPVLNVSLDAAPESRPVIDVRERRGTGTDTWLRVAVYNYTSREACTREVDPDEREVVAEGWVKLHGPDGDPNVWFRPLGC